MGLRPRLAPVRLGLQIDWHRSSPSLVFSGPDSTGARAAKPPLTRLDRAAIPRLEPADETSPRQASLRFYGQFLFFLLFLLSLSPSDLTRPSGEP